MAKVKKVDLARDEAWRRGILRWKLRPHQQKIYDQIKAGSGGSHYFNKARRIGGSYLLAVLAVETCLRHPGAQVKYAAPTAKAVRKIITPNIRKIIKDCPDDIKPKFSLLEGEWQFPNESSLAIAGCDNQQYENLRGTESHFVCLDEVGFIDDLEYILNDVLMPQTKDTKGMIVLTSTPARSPAHESFQIAQAHKAAGQYSECNVWEDTHYTREQHETFFSKMAESKGMSLEEFYTTTTFRREYMCEFVTDEERSVIPEWNKEVEKHLTKMRAIPEHRDCYVSLDIGWRDGMGVLFGYWDYRKAVLVIEAELLLFRKTAKELSEHIRAMEVELWAEKPPYLRISDNNLQTIADINSHGLTFVPTKKDDKELQVNTLREWVRSRKILINPKCKRLLSQLGSTVWNKQRTSYERNSEGHGDLLDALVYLVRNVRRDRNPFPSARHDDFGWVVTGSEEDQESRSYNGLMNAIQDVFEIG